VLIGMSSIRVVNTTSNYQKAKLITSISRIFISLALHTFWPITPKKSIKKEATSCIINLPKQINKGVTSKWILTQN
ncbi:hypothetical protein, partial [Gardnerella vaginalis]|uniref:hypothetical protein n=1 Tax=Gardnerella vaginalis TaxID=2702 RepID=UPI00397058A1